MTRSQPLEALESTHSLPPLTAELARAHSVDAAITYTCALIDSACSPEEIQIVWQGEPWQLLGSVPKNQQLYFPELAVFSALERGGLAVQQNDTLLNVFVPLIVRGELAGWLYLKFAACSPELSQWLLALAGQLSPTLAFLEAEHRHRVRQLHTQALAEIGQLIGGALDTESLLDAIYHVSRRVLDISIFYLALHDTVTNSIELPYVIRNDARVHQRYSWRANEGLTGVIVRRRATIRTDDYLQECERQSVRPRPLDDLPAGKAWIGVPLIAHDVVIGVLTISSSHPYKTYSQEDADFLEAIAAQTAVALTNTRLLHHNERQTRQLAVLNTIGRTISSSLDQEQVPGLIMEQVCQLLEVDEGSLLLVDQPTGDLVFTYTVGPIGAILLGQRVPRGQGIAGHVVTTGTSVITHNAQGDTRFYKNTDDATGFITRTMMAVPLRGVTGVQGVIEVINRRDGSNFTVEDRRLLEAVADQAVLALENARRFTQIDQALARRAEELARTNALMQHNLQSLTALNALSMAITTTLRDTNEILKMMARGVVEASGALGATVLLDTNNELRPAVVVGMNHAQLPIDAICRTVLASGRPERVSYSYPEHRVVLAVPMRAPRRTLGALCVVYEQMPDPAEQETVVLFATHAAAAIESLDLFAAVLDGRDQMSSILASTHEGMVLIGTDGRIHHTNAALHALAPIGVEHATNCLVDVFLAQWEAQSCYPAEAWQVLRSGLADVVTGQLEQASGALDTQASSERSLEWSVLAVRGNHATKGAALLVLRDITEAREAERLRHDLTNMIVHDLRSPLSSVMAAIDMMVRGIPGEPNDSQRNILGIAYSSAVQMLEMINTLLDISRLEDGRMPLGLTSCSIRTVVDRAINSLNTLARDRSVVILSTIAETIPKAWIDQDMVVRVVQNLLANAIKFSSRESTILVRADIADHEGRPMLQISVVDRGIGIAPHDRDKVFTKFGQVGESRGGTGLGLTFCKLAIEAHGGTIWLESALHQGSTFYFTVPMIA